MTTKFLPLDTAAFKTALNAAIATGKQRIAQIQALVEQAVYAQASHGKADYANNLMSKIGGRDRKQLGDFLQAHCANIRATTSADKDAEKAFLTKKGTKAPESKEAAHTAGMAAIEGLPNWNDWAKEKRESLGPQPYDFLKALTAMLDKGNKQTGVLPDQAAQFHAMATFIEYIRAGKSLADVRAEVAVKPIAANVPLAGTKQAAPKAVKAVKAVKAKTAVPQQKAA